MSRLRTTLARSDLDRTVQSQVNVAVRAIRTALASCKQARHVEGMRPSNLARVRRDLERCLGALESVRTVIPLYDVSDPDLDPDYRPARPNLAVPEPEPEVGPDDGVDDGGLDEGEG